MDTQLSISLKRPSNVHLRMLEGSMPVNVPFRGVDVILLLSRTYTNSYSRSNTPR